MNTFHLFRKEYMYSAARAEGNLAARMVRGALQAMSKTLGLPVSNPWRSIGVWMAGVLALSQLVNAARAVLDPAGFAGYLGLPLAAPADAGLLGVYALRAAFLGLFALFLIARREFVVLKWFALIAVLMPFGDLGLTYSAGAPPATVLRHAGYVVFILATAGFLQRFTSRSAFR